MKTSYFARHSVELVLAGFLATSLSSTAIAQGQGNVYDCNLTIGQQPLLKISDQASLKGAVVSDVQLITLHNGMRAVSFSVQYAPRLERTGDPLRVRYSVSWSDDCGRPINIATQSLQGFVLNPGQFQTQQSVALSRDASRAYLHIYVEPKNTIEPYPQ